MRKFTDFFYDLLTAGQHTRDKERERQAELRLRQQEAEQQRERERRNLPSARIADQYLEQQRKKWSKRNAAHGGKS